MKVHVGVDKDSGLIHSVATRAANSSDVVVASELLHGEEKVNAGYQGLQKREEMEGKEMECRIAMGPGNRRRLPATAEGELLRWMERAQSQGGAPVPCHQGTVWFLQNQATRHVQKSLQGGVVGEEEIVTTRCSVGVVYPDVVLLLLWSTKQDHTRD